jgi:hypothetical protein
MDGQERFDYTQPVSENIQAMEEGPTPAVGRISKHVVIALALVVIAVSAVVLAEPARAAWEQIAMMIELRSDQPPLAASPAQFSEHLIERVDTLPPQQQAELLLQAAINHYAGAIDMIPARTESWRGKLSFKRLNPLFATGINSNDLRVRAATIEVELAAYGTAKNAATMETIIQNIMQEPSYRPVGLWNLGLLANRGVEPERAKQVLMDYLSDPDQQTRYWAVEGLAHVGSDDIIDPLLRVFHDDPLPSIRERAACSLAQSGMLSQEQRMKAVPRLLDFLDDAALDAQTKSWVYQALRDITGQSLGQDPAAWHEWWERNRLTA